MDKDLAKRLEKVIKLDAFKGMTKEEIKDLVEARGRIVKGLPLLPHLMKQVEKKGLIAQFFVHRDTAPGCSRRGTGKHRLVMTCLLLNDPSGDFPPLVAAKGIAFRHRKDQWITDRGKEISLRRALRALKHPTITDSVCMTDPDLIRWARTHNILFSKREGVYHAYSNRGSWFGPIKLWGPELTFKKEYEARALDKKARDATGEEGA